MNPSTTLAISLLTGAMLVALGCSSDARDESATESTASPLAYCGGLNQNVAGWGNGSRDLYGNHMTGCPVTNDLDGWCAQNMAATGRIDDACGDAKSAAVSDCNAQVATLLSGFKCNNATCPTRNTSSSCPWPSSCDYQVHGTAYDDGSCVCHVDTQAASNGWAKGTCSPGTAPAPTATSTTTN